MQEQPRGPSICRSRIRRRRRAWWDPALLKAIARGRGWFDELVTGRALSLHELAKRDGISRRYIRRLAGLAFLSPELVEAILQGRQPFALTATRLTELDLPAAPAAGTGRTDQGRLEPATFEFG
jgi:hypothetical protein